MAIFVEYPLLAAGIGALFVAIGRWARCRTAVGIGVIWLCYAAYETGMQRRWLCSGECNIRVDLLLIYPFLVLGSAVAAFRVVQMRRRRR